tara:strand:- start:1221 stop:1688 length:468 start_codon:yes stop_codon:yes gene_type:complete
MGLDEYKKKRKFGEKGTTEPKAKKQESKDKSLIFVIHDHYATRHHHDLRLEMDGVLRSWAIPKLISPDSTEKRLAVMTEDHPMDYAKFKGVIPEGHYGAGKVDIFDNGTHKILEKDKGRIIFECKGKKMKGAYCLIKLKKNNEKDKNWLFFKKKE